MADTGIDSIGSIQNNREKYADYFSTTDADYLSMDSFFQLLLAEMSNQDPLEPTSNTEFISQLANFTSLQAQQDSLYYSNANYASSLVGKTVRVAAVSGSKFNVEVGVVTSMNLSDTNNFTISVNGNSYSLSNVMEIVSDGTDIANTSVNYDGAYATSLIGKTVTLETVNSSGITVIEQGKVEAVESRNGAFTLIVNSLAYNVSDVVRVEEATANTDDAATDSDEEENET